MDIDELLFRKEIEWAKSSFTEKGWITVYHRSGEEYPRTLLYPCMVTSRRIQDYRSDTEWGIHPGREGKPTIISTYSKGKSTTRYYSNYEKGLEPLIYVKDFRFADSPDEHYVDLAEEFILYFKLYEKLGDKRHRTFYFVDDNGELDEVIRITPSSVVVKRRYLLEFISIRKMFLAICFDCMVIEKGSLADFGLKPFDKNYEDKHLVYTHLLDSFEGKIRSWAHGKAFIPYDRTKTKSFYFDFKPTYEKFIVGYDKDGDHVLEECRDTVQTAFKLTYFKKEVLNKYLNEPEKYKVDGWTVSSRFFIAKIDNNNEDYVAAFLGDLSSLPANEQLHWKQFNIPPQSGISRSYYQTMIEGRWVDAPETPDLYFKHRYKRFNELWEEKFGWSFYKPLAKQDEHYFNSLHIPTTNNVKAFCEQMLSIVKLTIDRLNEKEFSKSIQTEPNDKGLTKLQKYLEIHGLSVPDMIQFLRNLQSLRSGLIAHSFSSSNKECQAALKYFDIERDNYVLVAREIFLRSITSLNTLERHFKLG